MNHPERIQKVMQVIESRLREEICFEELSSVAGYSRYHFQRICREAK